MASRLSIQVAERAVAITPSDSTRFTQPTRHIQVGGAGTLNLRFADGSTCQLPATVVTQGWQMSVACVQILATGTTATDIIAYF